MINLKDYFDVLFLVKDDIPNIKLSLKPKFKIGKYPIFKQKNLPISGSQLEYYLNYLGNEIGELVFNERKKLFSKNKLILWYIDNYELSDDVICKLHDYIALMMCNISKGLLDHYSSPEGINTKKKLVDRNKIWASITGKQNAERWANDIEWRTAQIILRSTPEHLEKMSNGQKTRWTPEYRDWYKKNVANNPIRTAKLSAAARKMWETEREAKSDKYYAMISNFKNKKFENNGIKMNSCEFLLSKILDGLNLNWKYELLFNFKGNGFLPDFYIADLNMIVECYGDFWHANPSIFNTESYMHTGKYAKDIWEYDNKKRNLFIENGFMFLYFWETDIKNNDSMIFETLNNYINEKH